MADIKELFSLKDRVAIVTGGGQGLGKSMAIGLAQAGANIVIAARRIESIMRVPGEGTMQRKLLLRIGKKLSM